jgi:hypothetical protein
MAAIMTLDEVVQDHFRRCAVEARRLYRDAVRPVFRRTPDGRPEIFGSSVLLEIDGVRCVATAAHVLDGHEEASIHIGGREEFLPLNLTFTATTKPGGKRKADSIDVAVARLSESDVEQLGDVPFIQAGDQMIDIPAGPGRFFLTCGYRVSQNKPPRPNSPMPPLRIWTYNGRGADVPGAGARLSGGHYNFAVDYPKWAKRPNGETIKTTSPKGVSGGAMFLLGDLADPTQLGSLRPHHPRLAGIAIECLDQEKVLIGAKLQAVRDALTRTS